MIKATKYALLALGVGAAAVGGYLAWKPTERPGETILSEQARSTEPSAEEMPPLYSPVNPASQNAVSAANQGFVIKHILPIQGVIKYGEWHWDEAGAPSEGPIVVTVDLEARVLSVFRDGYEIGAAAVLIGSEDKPTPIGIFPIMLKKKDHKSSTYDDAPMPYMQRLTNDGVALHATDVKWGYASHGCVGMPLEFARRVFGATSVGDKVYITKGKQVGLGDLLAEAH